MPRPARKSNQPAAASPEAAAATPPSPEAVDDAKALMAATLEPPAPPPVAPITPPPADAVGEKAKPARRLPARRLIHLHGYQYALTQTGEDSGSVETAALVSRPKVGDRCAVLNKAGDATPFKISKITESKAGETLDLEFDAGE